MIKEEIYRTPDCYVSDIEILTGKSYRTARRIMAKIKEFYGLSGRQRPTLEQAKSYLQKVN